MNQHVIHLKNGPVSVQPNVSQWIDSMRGKAGATPVLALIHFSVLPGSKEREALKNEGITLLEYIPDNTFTAAVQLKSGATAGTTLPASLQVHSITNMLPEWKADKYTWKQVNEQKGSVELLVTFYPIVSKTEIHQFIAAAGGQVDAWPMEQYNAFKVIINAGSVKALASWYGVQNISPVTPMYPLDLQSKPAVKGNVAWALPANGGYGLMGDDVTVGIGDNASGIYHADIKDRIKNFNPAGRANHGEHVNGIVGGSGNLDPLAQGMAPHANMLDFLYDLVLPATGAMYHDYNMTITNNSYAVVLGDCSYSGVYDGYARFLDTLIQQYPDVLQVFASGNDGYLTCSGYPTGYGTVAGGYQPAKNALVVGSMTDFLGAAYDESRGPVNDGRLKPEIIAVGLGAYSTIGIDGYEWAAGTSMASPQVAGGAALLTEYYKQLNGGVAPKADLLKAILMNGAMDIGNPGPDYSYGFGSMDVARSLKIIDGSHFFRNTINNGASQTMSIAVPANTAQVKIMLYWNDIPASTASATQLVNDLDLKVTDPAGTGHLPLVLNPAFAHVTDVANEQADHLNNVEQVVINNPVAGNYTVNVNGFSVPYPGQSYVVVYDIVPTGIQLTYPIGGEQLDNVDSVRIFWNTVADGHTLRIDFSANDGATWQMLADSLPAGTHYYPFIPSGLNTGTCKVRITKNGTTQSSVSGSFVVNMQPMATLDTAQCPGYINMHWNKVPGAASYLLLAKQGPYMQVVGTANDTTYTFSGMSTSEKSYIAVQPILNGLPGYRSVALSTIANTGNCGSAISTGDLMIEGVARNKSGRMFTQTQPSSNDTLSLKIRNLYNASCNSYSIFYQVNGGVWQFYNSPVTLPANRSTVVNVPGLDFSAVGTYNITAVVHNQVVADPQPVNDTIRFAITNIANDTLTLPFADDFEAMGVVSVSSDTLGLSPNGHWDFATGDSAGRMRSFVNDDVCISGSRSVSLDENQAVNKGSNNLFTGTFNLANYDTASAEIRLDFDYILAGAPKTAAGNIVSSRASDAAGWQPLFTYNLNAYPGFLNHAQSISLTDAARQASQNFSTSFQIAFGQNDTSLIAAPNYGNGITLDNIKIYTVANDAQLVKVISPLPTNCGLTGPQPLTVEVHNGVNYTLYNVQLFYSMDSGTVFTGNIDSITAKGTIEFTFTQQLTITTGKTHLLNVWLTEAGDTYNPNDSIMSYKFRNNNIVTTYPYLENFEAGDGGYYTEGINNSWAYGTPASPKINKAASGTKAWKTNLKGNYNNLEQSYLYSPCFDITGLTSPMLSFSAALDVENCGGTLCDLAYIEYSYDGQTWKKLGNTGQGTNWYDSTFNIWNTEGFTRWHVASIPIPLPVGIGVMSFRFVLNSDPGTNFEGFAIDDIHIFDRTSGIFPSGKTTVVTQNLPANTWQIFTDSGAVLAAVNAGNQTLSSVTATLYSHDTLYNPGATQYTFGRSYILKAPENVADSISVGLYLLESDVVQAINDYSCPSCTKVSDAYSLGVTQYDNTANSSAENNTFRDDSNGVFTYYPYKTIQWIPQDNGYYAVFKAKPFSEFWFNNGGPTGNINAGTDYLTFKAVRSGYNVLSKWQSIIDTAISTYSLERSTNDTSYATIYAVASAHGNPGSYSYTDTNIFPAAPVMFYRLKWVMKGTNAVCYSPTWRIDNTDSAGSSYLFTADAITRNAVSVNWTAFADGVTNRYILEREIGENGFEVIDTVLSARHYGERYQYTDTPLGIPTGGATIRYRLVIVLNNGDTERLNRVVLWPDVNSVPIVYPNPSTDGALNVTWFADAGTVMEVTLSDISGKRMYEHSYIANKWINNTYLSLPFKPAGVYMLRLNINGQVVVTKVVFQ